ncbi:uncharacterized protein LOC127717989 isoform X1 [Mytilus californianus]|uniref:uncharacterized protein LOC127717989 isoform X1 n=1 Tax=Mytilus californianus TaxID=6549 RepID=UPI00224566B2|nr:uncharacterized protein LOC127717989 isoform X1 [Mytilus californianus]XP_052079825.1 uncharacterized protein LOC127717989 isoform X1 [Mytilus californianus]
MAFDDINLPDSKICKIIIGVVAVGALMILILVPVSFSYLDYYEYGLKRQKSTGSVDKTEIYDSGRYFVGPDFEFKVFPSDLHYVELEDAKIFTSDKLEVDVTVNFQYVIRKDELISLHDTYDLEYEEIMKSSALDALKGAITVYTTRELINNRAVIEQTVWKSVRERLGGTCCNSYCGRSNPLCSTCKVVCTDSDKGLNVEVKYFQLRRIRIPRDVEKQFIQALVLQEQNEEEKLKQDAVVVRKETSQKVLVIENEAKEISQNATAQATLIGSIAQANYTAILESARSDGLKQAFIDLNFNQQEHKNSFDYLRTIRGQDNTHLTVNFQQKIAGNLGSN